MGADQSEHAAGAHSDGAERRPSAERSASTPDPFETWRAAGRLVDVERRKVFVVERGDRHAPVVAILHGYPSWSGDYALVVDALAAKYRVVLHDHLGYGLSDKPWDWGFSLFEQADIALGVWRALDVKRPHLIAHDYGTSVATEIVARGVPLASLTLTNGSVHQDLAHLRVQQRILRSRIGPLFARLANERTFISGMRAILRRDIDDAHLRAMWRAIEHPRDGRKMLAPLTRYIADRLRFRDRWIGSLTRLDVPAHVLWADSDPVAVTAIADALTSEIPGAKRTTLAGVGHYPMLEAPEDWVHAALAFLVEH